MTPVRNENQPLCRYSLVKSLWRSVSEKLFVPLHRRTSAVQRQRSGGRRACVCARCEQRQRVKVIYRSSLSAVHTKIQFASGVEPANSPVALNFLDSAGALPKLNTSPDASESERDRKTPLCHREFQSSRHRNIRCCWPSESENKLNFGIGKEAAVRACACVCLQFSCGCAFPALNFQLPTGQSPVWHTQIQQVFSRSSLPCSDRQLHTQFLFRFVLKWCCHSN